MESCSTNLCWIEVIPCSIFVYLTVWGCCDWYSKIYANLKCRWFASDLFKLIYVLKEFKNKEAFKKRLNSFLKVACARGCLFTLPLHAELPGSVPAGAGGAACTVQSCWKIPPPCQPGAWLSVPGASEPLCQRSGLGWQQPLGPCGAPSMDPSLGSPWHCLLSFLREAASPRRCVILLRYILALELGLLAPFASC